MGKNIKNLMSRVQAKASGSSLLASRGVNPDGSSMSSAQLSESRNKSRGALRRVFRAKQPGL